ncbi:MAG: cyclic nucleotide-binding domain-containing protein [Magnetococcus sp. MYC-9]
MNTNGHGKGVLAEEERAWLAEHGYLLTTMAEPECVAFLDLLDPVRLRSGDLLFAEGDPDDRLFIIRQGTVEMGQLSSPRNWVDFGPYGCVALDDSDHLAVWLRRADLREGDCAGELGFAMGQPHLLTARARGDVLLFRLDAEDVKRLADKNSRFCHCLAKALAKTFQSVAAGG